MIPESLYQQYQTALLNGDKTKCRQIVGDRLEEGIPIRVLYSELFQRSLYEVGRMWERNQISVAKEHLVTSITESLMGLVYPYLFAEEHTDRRAVVSCCVNEYHQIGARMVADLFELNGWNSYFLGANTPVSDLLALIEEKKPDLVALSISVYFNMKSLIDILDAVFRQYPDLQILVGGQAFAWGGQGLIQRYENAIYLDTLEKLEQFIRDYQG